MVAAGDIAAHPTDGLGTARLIRRIAPDAVLTLGDNAYDEGSLADYRRNYHPTWGQFKAITRPVPGNHEYYTDGAAGYFAYFRDQVGGAEYYAWTAGHWRMYALNCEVACGEGSEQLDWLRQDLAAHADQPALAYLHEPLFSCSTRHRPLEELRAVWAALKGSRGKVMLSGHNHAYERFVEQDAHGGRDADGLRQFVVGTGGADLHRLRPRCVNRRAAHDRSAGVLRLTLRADSYAWSFIDVDNRVLDRGRDRV